MKKKKLFTIALLLSLPSLLGSKSDYRYFEFADLELGPIEKGKDYALTSGVYTYMGGVTFTYTVALYDRYPSKSNKVLLWEFSERRTTSYDNQQLTFDYVIPASCTMSTMYFCFSYAYNYYTQSSKYPSYSKSSAYVTLEPYEKVGDEVFSFNENEEIVGVQSAKMRLLNTTRYSRPSLMMYTRVEEGGDELGRIPLSNCWRLHLYNKEYGESLVNDELPDLDARLEITGKEAAYFSHLADYYYPAYNGGTAGFKMRLKRILTYYHCFALPEDTFLVSDYTGEMRRGKRSQAKEGERETDLLYLPRLKEPIDFSVRLFTTKKDTYHNFPRFEMKFVIHGTTNRFGNCFDSDYCVGASYE